MIKTRPLIIAALVGSSAMLWQRAAHAQPACAPQTPCWTTATRPAAPAQGQLGFSTDIPGFNTFGHSTIAGFEFYNGTTWQRMFTEIGGTINDNYASPQNPSNFWLNTYAYGAGGTLTVYSEIGGEPLVTATRSSDRGTSVGPVISSMHWCFNDNVVVNGQPCWGQYVETRRYPTSGGFTPGTAFGMELVATEFGTSGTSDPYANFFISNNSTGLWMGSGGNCTAGAPCYNPATTLTDLAAQPATQAIAIFNNGGTWRKGITFGSNALEGNDGITAGQTAPAIVMPKGDFIGWQYCTTGILGTCAADTYAAKIYSNVTSTTSAVQLVFGNFGLEVQNLAGTVSSAFLSPTNAQFGVSTMTTWPLSVSTNVGTGPVYPANLFGFFMGFNFASLAEADFMNANTSSTTSFNFYQKTGAASNTRVLSLTAAGDVIPAASVQLKALGAATILAVTCNAAAEGKMYAVTDANSAVFNAALASGGTNHMIAYCNGTGWVIH